MQAAKSARLSMALGAVGRGPHCRKRPQPARTIPEKRKRSCSKSRADQPITTQATAVEAMVETII